MLIEQIVHQATTLLVPLSALVLALFFLALLRRRQSHTPTRRRDDKLLTVEDVAQICGVKPHTIRKWFRDGLPAARIGRTELVRRKDLDAFVDNHITVSIGG